MVENENNEWEWKKKRRILKSKITSVRFATRSIVNVKKIEIKRRWMCMKQGAKNGKKVSQVD